MACSCHGKDKVRTVKTLPTDQCTLCAHKHMDDALSLFREIPYERINRRVVVGFVRDAMRHLQIDHRDVALELRDLAIAIDEVRDAEYPTGIITEIERLADKCDELFIADNPLIIDRLNNLNKET
ncbi:MAG: hypothetical protein E7047_03825 [Lentisphaerae bacterium]|nr:hypothetical protein [Lentisphaerota bacterium]